MRRNKWLEKGQRQRKLMNKQNEMKEMIRNGGKDRKNWWRSKMRWNKWLEMVEMTAKTGE
jgi:hypothetical protein